MAAKIFGVVHNKAQFCEIRYSWYIKHHHTLKRQYHRFRVVEQMNRVIRDHLESSYIEKAEYRAVKEPDQELDYIIRYYPGAAAGESIDRIQTHLRRRRTPQRLLGNSRFKNHQQAKEGDDTPVAQSREVALSMVTAHDVDLITQLLFRYGISATKAFELTLKRKKAVVRQIEAWPFRDTKVRNLAGWMIQAIESEYDVPAAYSEYKEDQVDAQKHREMQAATSGCELCDTTGFRFVRSEQYPTGAMRQCSHDPVIERSLSLDAQNGPLSSANFRDEKRSTEESASP